MHITNFIRNQLIAFGIITVVALVTMALFYIKIPALFGIGRYETKVLLSATGGLYKNGNVTYRGVNVGKVKSVALSPAGVVATLSIDSDVKIPANSSAAVRSVSAVGEQYVEFKPATQADAGYLKNGSVINGTVPVEISELLNRSNTLLTTVKNTRLREVMNEAFLAFNGRADDLQRLLDSMQLFAGEANKNSDVTAKLVEQALPLLESQATTNAEIRAWTANISRVTDQLRVNNPELLGILQKGPEVARDVDETMIALSKTIPMLVDNGGTVARTLAVYHKSMKQILVLYPRLIAMFITAVNTADFKHGVNSDFRLQLQAPPACTVGYLPFSEWRSPAVQTARELPPGLMCRISHDNPVAVRGSRNFPCIEYPGRRAPTPRECREGYKPLPDKVVAFPKGLPFGLKLPKNLEHTNGVGGYLMQPSAATTQPTDLSSPAIYAGTYDPRTGNYIGPDGKSYRVDPSEINQPSMNLQSTGATSKGQPSWINLLTPQPMS